jgi:hypothetical protein
MNYCNYRSSPNLLPDKFPPDGLIERVLIWGKCPMYYKQEQKRHEDTHGNVSAGRGFGMSTRETPCGCMGIPVFPSVKHHE